MRLVILRHARDPDGLRPSAWPLSIRGYVAAALLGVLIRCGERIGWIGSLSVSASDMPRASTTAGILFGHRNVAWTGALREAADADIPPRLRGPDWTGTGERWSDVVDRVRSELAHTLALGDDTVWVAHSGTMDAAMEALQVPAVPAELNPGFLWMMVFDLKYLSAESGRATPQTVINYFGPSWCGLKYLRRGC